MRSVLALVRVVSGLEWLAAEEVAAAGHRVVEVSKRQVVVEASEGLVERPPRVADDLFLVCGAVPDPGRGRAGLAGAVRAAVESVPEERDAFAVSASFVGVRNFNRFDVEDLVGERIGRRYHSRRYGVAPPVERRDWRVVLDGKTLWIGRRPYDVPLHRRVWRERTVPGSLHPPVAAAMARLASLAPGHDVLDPFCGAGTVLLEAHAVEPRAEYVGLDRDPGAIAAAKANTAKANTAKANTAKADAPGARAGKADAPGARAATAGAAGVRWCVGDARRLDGTDDRIITNPPWNRRVRLGDLTPYLSAWRRTLDGLLVAILMPEQAAALSRGWRVQARYDVSVAGRHPVIVVASPEGNA